MSHQPLVIPDPFDFARRSAKLSGDLDARSLPRLAEVLRETGSAQNVSYSLRGFRLDDKSFVDVFASAELTFLCQRCLTDVVCGVKAEARLLLVPKGDPLPDEGLEIDDYDPVEASRDFDVLDAVEEELLLAMPLAPTHEKCSLPVAKDDGDDRSPFALLKGFKAQR